MKKQKTIVERLSGLIVCAPGCEGRCRDCPQEVVDEAKAKLETMQQRLTELEAENKSMEAHIHDIGVLFAKQGDELAALKKAQKATATAYQQFTECEGAKEPDPIERLRFFCSLAMAGQDWLDAEPFFDALTQGHGEPVVWYREAFPNQPTTNKYTVEAWRNTGWEVVECFRGATATPDAHELWAAAQLVPGEGIEDGVARIEALFATPGAKNPD
jgi:hypothetical protein